VAPPDGLFDDYRETIVVVTINVGANMSLERVESVSLKALRMGRTGFTDVESLSSERTTLDGHQAYEDHFTGRLSSGPSEGLPLEVVMNTTLVGRTAYVVSFGAEVGEPFDSWLPSARGIIDSIQIEGNKT
jgi:hypothetical protein